MFPLPLHIYFEIAALIASIIFWRRIQHTILKWFIPFLAFIVAVELTGRYIGKVLRQPNVWLYNISIPIEYLFISFIFYSYYRKRANQYLAMWFLILFTVFVLFNITLIQGMNKFNTNTLVFGSFFLWSSFQFCISLKCTGQKKLRIFIKTLCFGYPSESCYSMPENLLTIYYLIISSTENWIRPPNFLHRSTTSLYWYCILVLQFPLYGGELQRH